MKRSVSRQQSCPSTSACDPRLPKQRFPGFRRMRGICRHHQGQQGKRVRVTAVRAPLALRRPRCPWLGPRNLREPRRGLLCARRAERLEGPWNRRGPGALPQGRLERRRSGWAQRGLKRSNGGEGLLTEPTVARLWGCSNTPAARGGGRRGLCRRRRRRLIKAVAAALLVLAAADARQRACGDDAVARLGQGCIHRIHLGLCARSLAGSLANSPAEQRNSASRVHRACRPATHTHYQTTGHGFSSTKFPPGSAWEGEPADPLDTPNPPEASPKLIKIFVSACPSGRQAHARCVCVNWRRGANSSGTAATGRS
eukprot:gnl/Chilomastix_cuspidata/4465.p1 GENE.gnl/Chilomastix_cuspidata/4465~~gnl/Chilomastix_cuspidata/4465.p1  ORF type:complete len:312 (+),score=-46.25 gnl/Chilomastix_cuspidata/4465:247-1182(+)